MHTQAATTRGNFSPQDNPVAPLQFDLGCTRPAPETSSFLRACIEWSGTKIGHKEAGVRGHRAPLEKRHSRGCERTVDMLSRHNVRWWEQPCVLVGRLPHGWLFLFLPPFFLMRFCRNRVFKARAHSQTSIINKRANLSKPLHSLLMRFCRIIATLLMRFCRTCSMQFCTNISISSLLLF